MEHDSISPVEAAISPLPDDVEALKALVATMARRVEEAEQNAATATAQLANAMAHQSAIEALIAHLKLQIAKLKREQYGPSAERSRRLLGQMELQLEDLEADAAEDDLIAEEAAAKTTTVTAFERKRPARKPFPEHLPRERVVVPAPCSCPACGGGRLSKLGEDVTETREVTRAALLYRGDGSLRHEPLLRAFRAKPRPRGSSDPTDLCEAVRQTAKE